MVKTCKYVQRNALEGKCKDYFISHSKGSRYMCRITEWRKKKGICPYDKSIYSQATKISKAIKDKKQMELE